MLLGANVFDFSGVDDPCTSSRARVKVTACGSGQFTCDDGQCVPIDERCNQISNCRSGILFYQLRGYLSKGTNRMRLDAV